MLPSRNLMLGCGRGAISGLVGLFLPLSVLFEGLGALPGVATPVGEVDIVEVVAAAAGDGGEVFDGEGHAVAWR